jgi:hypothetical protein
LLYKRKIRNKLGNIKLKPKTSTGAVFPAPSKTALKTSANPLLPPKV